MLDYVYSLQDNILFFARLVLGVTFVLHGWPKIKNPLGMKGWLSSMRFPLPSVLSAIVAVVEFFGGLFLVFNILTPVVALLIAFNMVVAGLVKKINLKKGWVDGYELDLSLLALALLVATLSFDYISF